MSDPVDYERAINRWQKLYGDQEDLKWSNPAYAKEYALAHPEVVLPEPDFESYVKTSKFLQGPDFFEYTPDKHGAFWAHDKVTELAVGQESRFVTYAEEYVENKVLNFLHASAYQLLIPLRYWYYWVPENEHVKSLTISGCIIVSKIELRPTDTDRIMSELLKEE